MSSQPPSAPPGSPPATPPTAGRWQRAMTSWRGSLAYHHDFRQLWIGDTVSQVGTQLTVLALPVLAVQMLGATEFQMGVLATCEMLAFLVVGLPSGALVDRWRKKRVLIAGDLVRGVALLTLPAAWALDVLTLGHLYVVALDAVSFIGSVVYTVRIRHAETPPERSSRRPLRTEIAEGLSFVVHQPLLVRITACTATSNLFSSITGALLVLYALRDLDLTAATLGFVYSAGAVGGLLGAVTTTRITRWVGEGRAIPLAALWTAPFAALTPLASVLPSVPALVMGSVGMFFGIVVYNVTQVSFRQRLCPKPLLGRMNASIRFIVWGTMPIGSFVGGLLGEHLGIVTALWISAAGVFVAALPVLLSPLIRMRDLPRELDAHA